MQKENCYVKIAKVAIAAYRGVVQLVERQSPKLHVQGSSPCAPAKKKAIRESGWLFSMKRADAHEASCEATREAGLRPMKRAFGTRKTSRALRFTATKLLLHTSRKACASYSRSECFIYNPLALPTILWYNEREKGGIASINTAKEGVK